jgi:hypothetical protein
MTAGNELLGKFCSDLEKSIVESIEAGFYTKVRATVFSPRVHGWPVGTPAHLRISVLQMRSMWVRKCNELEFGCAGLGHLRARHHKGHT